MEAFQAGSGMEGQAMSLLIAGVGCTMALLVAAWILLSAYRGYAKQRIDGDLFSTVGVKALLLVLLLFWLFL
nr:TIGR03758 family integrating conjugative element protein [uncultured Halomonas sp.]